MNDLFGDDKKYMRSEEKDSKTLRNGKKKRNDGSRKADKWEKQQKEDGESPDSGIVDSGSVESDREPREQQRDHPCTSSIIDVMARLDPMLSPVRQPSLPPVVRNDGITSLKCVLDLSTLSSNERSRLFKNVHSVKAMMEKTGLPPKPALSPTPRPSLCHSPSPFSTKSLSPAQLSQETRKSCTSLPSVSRDAKKTDWKADNELSKSSSFTRQRVNSDVVATSKQKRDDFDAESSSSSASHKNGLIKVHTTSTSVDEMKNERRAVKKNNSSEPSRLYKKSSNASSSTVLVQKNEDREKIERPGSSFSESSASTKKREGQREKERTKDVEKGKLGSKEKEKVKVEVESGSNGAVKPEKDICGEKSCDELTIKKERRNTSSEKPLPLKKPHRTSMSCHAGMLAPKCKFKLELNDDGSFKSANYYQNDVARPLKHKADHETSDKMRKIMLYFDSVVYFILSAATLSSSQNRQCTMVKETAELLKNTTNRFAVINNSFTPRMIHFVSRLKVLSARVQSVLNYHVYKSQEPQAYKYSAALSKFDSQCHELEAAALRNEALANVTGSQSARSAATPSPASSTHSAANERFKEITLPLAVYQLQKGLVKIFQSKLNSQQLWDKTNSVMEPIDREMILTLDRICGELTMESGLVQLSEYLATGVAWLRDEYEDEKASEQQFT
ncbi:hypothetical protein AB6A40_003672 [Gnathostoma spinigerum]|uniref:AF4/FMR2 family member lilli n=1 Tax=Gnathostoma spinigerum TaxID=75299 RepID=A0ABD6EJ12_9BILA